MESKSYTMDFAGRPLTLEFGRYCEQANGSVWVHLGDTVVMVNATMSPAPRYCSERRTGGPPGNSRHDRLFHRPGRQ